MSSTASATHGAAILLVDDNEVSAEIMEMTLEGLGHIIALAGDGKEALNLLNSEPSVKLVITDLAMPEMDGLELARHIKESDKFKDVEVILLTGSDDEGLARRAGEAGCTSYLVKPVHPKLLVELVQEILGPR